MAADGIEIDQSTESSLKDLLNPEILIKQQFPVKDNSLMFIQSYSSLIIKLAQVASLGASDKEWVINRFSPFHCIHLICF
jgi:hypothetical protein